MVQSSVEDIKQNFMEFNLSVNIELIPINPLLIAVCGKNNRSSFFETIESQHIASNLSKIFEKALLICYDNRTSFREAVLFKNGLKVQEFDSKDEIYVLLDENGEPLKKDQTFSHKEIEINSNVENEYECIVTAIDVALSAFGGTQDVNLSILKSVICYQSKL